VLSSVCAVCSRQTVMPKDSTEALHQNRNPTIQEAGLSSLAGVFRDPPSKIIEEVTSWCVLLLQLLLSVVQKQLNQC